MFNQGLRTVRIGVGALAGLALWSVWQLSARTSAELESVNDRYQLSQMLGGGHGTGVADKSSPVFIIPIQTPPSFQLDSRIFEKQFSQLITEVEAENPAVVGIAMDLRGMPSLCQLQTKLKTYNNVVFGYFGNSRSFKQASSELCGAEELGHMEIPRELGGIFYLLPRTNGNVQPFSSEVVSRLNGSALSTSNSGEHPLAMNLMYRPRLPLSSLPAQRFCRISTAGTGEQTPYALPLRNTAKKLTSKIVLIGLDDVPTKTNGQEPQTVNADLFLQANAIDTLVNRAWRTDYTRAINPIDMLAFVLICSTLFASLSAFPRFVIWLTGCAVSALVTLVCFDIARIILPFGGPLLLFHCSYFAGTIINLETDRIEKSRRLAAALQQQLEDERKRIAKDMHDEVLPTLSRVMRLSDKIEQAENESDSIPQEIRAKLESTITEMRKIIDNLYPPVIDSLGLILALEHLVGKFSSESGIKSSFTTSTKMEEELILPPFHKLCLYRIVQEALNNVEKHSGASEVDVAIVKDGHFVRIQVADNGIGYDSRKSTANNRGLQIIQQRALAIGAKIQSKKPNQFQSGSVLQVSVALLNHLKHDTEANDET